MSDTQNFINLQNQFNAISISVMLDGREKVQEPYRTKINDVYNEIKSYFDDDKFRNSVDIGTKNALEGQITNILAQFNQLLGWQNDGVTPIPGQLPGLTTNIESYIGEFLSRKSPLRQLFDLQGGRDISKIIDSAEEKEKLAEQTMQTLSKKLTQADQLLGARGSNDLADYYQLLSDGQTVHDLKSKKNTDTLGTIKIKGGWLSYFITSILIYIVSDWLWNLINNNSLDFKQISLIGISLILPLITYASIRFINAFNFAFKGGFKRTAYLWMIGAIFSTVITAIYAAVLVAELGSNAGWQNIVPKLIGLLAPAYFIRFCVQNYRANIHLSIQNGQKAMVARVVESFSDLVRHDNLEYAQQVLTERSKIILSASKVVFTPSESGFLTTKEGAGGNDNMLDGILNIRR